MDNLLLWVVKGGATSYIIVFAIMYLLLRGTHRQLDELRKKYLRN